MHVYKPPPVGGLDRVPVFTAGTGSTRADLFELDGVTPMPGNVLVADTSGNLPSFQCATSPVYVGVSGSRTTWQPSESGTPSPAASSVSVYVVPNGSLTAITPDWPGHCVFEVTAAGTYYIQASVGPNGVGASTLAEIYCDPPGSMGTGTKGTAQLTSSGAPITISVTALLSVGDVIVANAPAVDPSVDASGVLIIGPAQPTLLAAFPT